MIRPLHVLDAAAFARERLGFDADPIQAQILEVGHTRGLLNCCGATRKGAEYPGIFGDDAAGGRGGSGG